MPLEHPLNLRPLTPRESAFVLARVRPLLGAEEERQLAEQERDLLAEGRQPYEAGQQLAEMLVRMAYVGQWVDRPWANEARACWQKIETGTYEPEPEPVDPLFESARQNIGAFDPWQRDAALRDPQHVQTLGPRRITNTYDSETGAGVLRLGGDAA